jgi:hypothetical protein
MRFRTTYDILKGIEEYFDPNWMDSDKVILPPTYEWSYERPMKIEDVDIWEVIYEQGGGFGIYAAWCPYAEFYIVRMGWTLEKTGYGVEAYYGPGAQDMIKKKMKELKIPYPTNKIWVEPYDMHKYVIE